MNYKEHKKLYKAGKQWVVATLTATTITLLGGISAYTVHADATSDTQSIQAESINQTNQNDNSNNSVALKQTVPTQNNQTVQSDQSLQEAQEKQVYSSTPINETNATATNTSDDLDHSSLWYQPSVSGFEGDVERSGLGDVHREIQDPLYPNITVYYSFLDSNDKPEIQNYAHTTVSRYIYIKDPQSTVENLSQQYEVYFNRWVAVDTSHSDQVVGVGPWVFSLTSPLSFPEYPIPQIDGYVSYCNGEKATTIDKEQLSGYKSDEFFHITYVPAVDKNTRTIIIQYPTGGQEKIVQKAELDGSTYSWPEYTIPVFDGYDSYVNGYKEVSVPEQTVGMNSDNTTVNVTYQKTDSETTHKTITRIIDIHDIDGHVEEVYQTVNYIRYVEDDAWGNKVSYTNWVADGNDSWAEYIIPQREGYKSQVDSQDAKSIPSRRVSPDDDNIVVNVTYKKELNSRRQYSTITRTIYIHDIDGHVDKVSQTVNYTRNIVVDAWGNIESHTNWVADGDDSWAEYIIPQYEGYKSQVDSQDIKSIPSQLVNPDDDNTVVNVTYKKKLNTSQQHRTFVRTIYVHDIDGHVDKVSQTVNYTRNVITDAQGNIVSHTAWSADGNDNWGEYVIPQHEGYKSQVDSHDATIVPSQNVNPDDKDVDISITYIKTDSSKNNGNDDDNTNPSRLDNEVPYDSTTVSNNINANYGNLDGYRLTENGQGQAQLIVNGWHATGESNSDRYRYMIVFDNTLGREIARQKLFPQVRSDVQRAYPDVDNSLYSGFNITIDIPNSSINHSLSLVSRYSNDPNNGEGDRVDHWFNSLAFNEGNQANLDGLSSNGNIITVNGWHATNQAAGRPYHYIIAWDRNLGREIARQEVTTVSRPDVANVYNTVANAINSGFSVNFNLTPQFFNDSIQFISRWTDDATGNGNAVDYWFKPINRTNRANLDSVTLSNGQLHVAGWHATDLSQIEPNHYLIVFDNTTGQQVVAEKVDLQSSQDVKDVFGDIQTSDHSRFDYTFNALHLIPGHNYSLVSRYSTDGDGNGNNGSHTDSWLNIGAFQQSAYSIDNVAFNSGHMLVQGWLANDNAMTKPYAYAILIQNGQEIGRQRLNLSERDDVAKAYPKIYRIQYSGFGAEFNLPTLSTRGLQLVLRFTDDPAGNGNSSDNWINL